MIVVGLRNFPRCGIRLKVVFFPDREKEEKIRIYPIHVLLQEPNRNKINNRSILVVDSRLIIRTFCTYYLADKYHYIPRNVQLAPIFMHRVVGTLK